ncbi:hypothetical protein CYLTODRAFT_417284 [Cylindrobasidium torrendii FP15055 ss-10]|uniref:Uncharacterized protein n=1 Tax=Cylindrobasidium torrendii FP15055 ss-10 TaxID=1314674 RepID=A0A0D7BRZ8_9AGAR|nr:hypothetical protein CYLTODRAFT_417284 [Cylindrobasidium torrendii FP15055 ss-10]
MCRLDTFGPKYTKCAHYIPDPAQSVKSEDCGSSHCRNSANHSRSRNHSCEASNCQRHYGADRNQTITHLLDDFCWNCRDYYLRQQQQQAVRRA